MCCGCWREDGAPILDNDRVRRIVALLSDADHYGALHIVVDDNNLEDSSLAFCRKWGADHGNWTEHDEVLCAAMEAATFEERVSAMGVADGCYQLTSPRLSGEREP